MKFGQIVSAVETILVVSGLWPAEKSVFRGIRATHVCYIFIRGILIISCLFSNVEFLYQNIGKGSAIVKSIGSLLNLVLTLSTIYVGAYQYKKARAVLEKLTAYHDQGKKYLLITSLMLLTVSSGPLYSRIKLAYLLWGNHEQIIENQILNNMSKTKFEAYLFVFTRIFEPIQYVFFFPVVIIFLFCTVIQMEYNKLKKELTDAIESKEIYKLSNDKFCQLKEQHDNLRKSVDCIEHAFCYFIIPFTSTSIYNSFSAVYLFSANCITKEKFAVFMINDILMPLILCSSGSVISKAVCDVYSFYFLERCLILFFYLTYLISKNRCSIS